MQEKSIPSQNFKKEKNIRQNIEGWIKDVFPDHKTSGPYFNCADCTCAVLKVLMGKPLEPVGKDPRLDLPTRPSYKGRRVVESYLSSQDPDVQIFINTFIAQFAEKLESEHLTGVKVEEIWLNLKKANTEGLAGNIKNFASRNKSDPKNPYCPEGSGFGFVVLTLRSHAKKNKPNAPSGHILAYYITPHDEVLFLDAQSGEILTDIPPGYHQNVFWYATRPQTGFIIKQEPTTPSEDQKEPERDNKISRDLSNNDPPGLATSFPNSTSSTASTTSNYSSVLRKRKRAGNPTDNLPMEETKPQSRLAFEFDAQHRQEALTQPFSTLSDSSTSSGLLRPQAGLGISSNFTNSLQTEPSGGLPPIPHQPTPVTRFFNQNPSISARTVSTAEEKLTRLLHQSKVEQERYDLQRAEQSEQRHRENKERYKKLFCQWVDKREDNNYDDFPIIHLTKSNADSQSLKITLLELDLASKDSLISRAAFKEKMSYLNEMKRHLSSRILPENKELTEPKKDEDENCLII